MKKALALLYGKNPDPRTVILMSLWPAAFVVYLFLTYPFEWKLVATAFLAFDILAGLLSNSTEGTHEAWRELPKKALVVFVIFHLTLYPLLVVLFSVDTPLMMFLLATLVVKTAFFAIGTGLWICPWMKKTQNKKRAR